MRVGTEEGVHQNKVIAIGNGTQDRSIDTEVLCEDLQKDNWNAGRAGCAAAVAHGKSTGTGLVMAVAGW